MRIKKIKSNLNQISFIIPIYNEEERLPFLLNYLKKYSKKNKNKEIIFVNDGSKDKSEELIHKFIINNKRKNFNFEIITYKKNMGKGYALKRGVLRSKKQWILTVDADLSVKFEQVDIWRKKNFLNTKKNIAYFGSRIIKGSNMKALFIRKFIGFFFRIFQNLIIGSEIKDTQCGFKLYNSVYAKEIFTNLKTNGFAHDVELIYLLKKKILKY